MKERPILFNGDMVRAILDGRKTQTRRLMKPQPEPTPDDYTGPAGHWWPSDDVQLMVHVEQKLQNQHGGWDGFVETLCPYGRPGDRLWVRETWARYNIDQDRHDMAYRATLPRNWPADGRWRPSIHMPRWASRITLEITSVRVERLQDISEEDSISEGYDNSNSAAAITVGWYVKPQRAFQRAWEWIYGPDSWAANPWVWVIEFKRVEVVEEVA